MSFDDGGPAFARPYNAMKSGISTAQTGMSLRDWFAGMALQGLVIDSGGRIVDDAGELAYHIADAMIAERRKGEEKE